MSTELEPPLKREIIIPFKYDYLNPDYVAVFQHRTKMLQKIRQQKSAAWMRDFYGYNPIQFIADWGLMYEPRNIELKLPSKIPFIPFKRQIDWMEWVLERWASQERGITIKARGSGMSWSILALACTLCLFNRGMSIGFGSRKAEYVDNGSDPKSLFFKARFFLKHLPPEFRAGWDQARDSRTMRISFPENESFMTGECGDQIGRGDRTSLYIVDESGFLEHPELAEASLSDTTNCRIDISTSPGPDTVFADRILEFRQQKRSRQVFEFSHADDPRRDEKWLKRKRSEVNPEVFKREYEMSLEESGEFFTEASFLVKGKPVTCPQKVEGVYAIIDTAVKSGQEHDGLAVVYFAISRYIPMIPGDPDPTRPWLIVLDWHLTQMDGALLEAWLPSVFVELERFAAEFQALKGSLGAWIEDKATGSVLIQQAANKEWPAQAIDSGLTAMGKAERAIDVSSIIWRGDCKFSTQAYEKTVEYKGVTKNHLLSQALSFRAGVADQKKDDLLDCLTYGCAIGLGNREGF